MRTKRETKAKRRDEPFHDTVTVIIDRDLHDQIYAALCDQHLTLPVASFLTDLAMRVKALEEK